MSAKSKIENRLKVIGAPKVDPLAGNDSLLKKWNACLKVFSRDIEKYYIDNKQTKEEFEEKLELLEEIKEYVENHICNQPIGGIEYEVKAVIPFGSSASALGMKGGDLDLTICVHPALGKNKTYEIHERSNRILAKILKHIESGKMLGDRELEMEHISGARVPIVTGLIDETEVDVSISMTTLVSAQYLAAKYVDAYEKYDRNFILLSAFVKYWQKSKKTDKNEEYYRTVFPNSCSTVLMVVFFMKYYQLLPNVVEKHKDILEESHSSWNRVNGGENGSYGIPKIDVANWKKSNVCDVSVGTLFLLFLDFYTNIVDFRGQKLVIQSGELIKKRKDDDWDKIVIDDIGDKQNPARAVTEIITFKKWLSNAVGIVTISDPKEIVHKLMKGTL